MRDFAPIVPDELLARMRVHLANARMAHGAQAALDASGRYLLAASPAGRLLWCTPQATKLLGLAAAGGEVETFVLPEPVRAWLQRRGRAEGADPETVSFRGDGGRRDLQLTFMGRISPGEILLRLTEGGAGRDERVLHDKLSLTAREAEVLLWTARGKSNRDIGEILKLSPRTVNKHLEQIYAKLGVENRTAAAAIAMRVIAAR